MAEDLKRMKTLMLRLEAAVSRIEDVADSQQTVTSVPTASGSSALDATPTEPAAPVVQRAPDPPSKEVAAFDNLLSEFLQPFLKLSTPIDPLVSEIAQSVNMAFQAQREIIMVASKSTKPVTGSADFVQLLAPLQAQLIKVGEVKDKNRRSPLFNHLSTVADGIPALGWVAVPTAPASFVGEMKDSAQFYANRVIKEFKEKEPAHVEWVRSFIKLLTELQQYVKNQHTTGLAWNAKGQDLKASLEAQSSSTTAGDSSSGSALPPPPPPPPGPPPPPFSGDSAPSATESKGDMNSVFADLNKGSSVTAGLKKIDKSQMTHKNPSLRGSSVVPDKRPTPSAKPAALTKQPSYMKKPARTQLEGTKWIIENYEDNPEVIIPAIELNHTVYVYNCKNSTISIKGKFNALSLDGCTKVGVVVDTLVSSIDLVKSKSFAIQVLNKCPTVICDVCESGQIYLSKTGFDCEIITSKCGSINVNIEGPDGDFKEEAVPEMLKHQVVNGKLETSIVVHAD